MASTLSSISNQLGCVTIIRLSNHLPTSRRPSREGTINHIEHGGVVRHMEVIRGVKGSIPHIAHFILPGKKKQEGTIKELAAGNHENHNRLILRSNCLSNPEIVVSSSQASVSDVSSDPPLVSALKAAAEEDVARFHFPGHNRGRAAPSSLTHVIGKKPFWYDLALIPQLDSLFSPKRSILHAQQEAAKLFGSSETWFLVGGSTCGVQAAIMATCSPGDYLILPQNSHISAISGMVLSGALPKYIIPEYNSDWDISGGITPSQVEEAMKELEAEGRQAAAVLIISPTYHGICSDLSEIARLCHSHGIHLIVDEAHGAHFSFHSDLPSSALEQGADLAIQSTHKVLCSLTQSAMLHMSGNVIDREKICRCLQVLQSTSPSFLLMASLDGARSQLSENPKTIFNKAMALALEIKDLVEKIPGISLLELPNFSSGTAIDRLRITVGVWKLGLSGYEADNILLNEHGIIPELVGTQSLTFAINLGTSREHVQRLIVGLEHLSTISTKKSIEKAEVVAHAPYTDITISLNPREAFFADQRTVSIRETPGEVCGELFPGEIITEGALNYLLDVTEKGAEITGTSDPLLPSIVVCEERTIKKLATLKQKNHGRFILRTNCITSPEIIVSHPQKSDSDVSPPLVSAIKASAEEDIACFHFPGHNRGRAAPSSLIRLIGKAPFEHDLPELPQLDNFFSPKGSVLYAQQEAAKLFGSSETWFLVGGTTCGIQAAIMATCSPGDYLILPRNSHVSAISGMVLCGALPKYVIPEYNSDWEIGGGITPSQVEEALKELEAEGCQASSVLVTSPTYQGICSDLSEIASLCHSRGIPLIVDEAHGAHFRFHCELPSSALEQGADLVIQSTHKVLCSFTQSSMLHMSGDIVDRVKICRCLQVLQSTSPSHLLLASLDAARSQLSENPKTIFDKAMALAVEIKSLIKNIPGISLLKLPNFPGGIAIDHLRITVGVWKLGLSGYEADHILFDKHRIIPELVGTRSLTFAINLGTGSEHVQRLIFGLEHLSTISAKKSIVKDEVVEHAPFTDITISLNPREAFFANKRCVNIRESPGMVCGELICPYPPGIPVLFPGEIITEKALNYLLDVIERGAQIAGASDPLLASIVVCEV